MSDLPVTQVTADATRDDLTDADYKDIYEELRRGRSLDALCDLVGSQYSRAWWSRYEKGDMKITRAARNELRRGVGLPQLPPTTEEAIHLADPDARVYQVGCETPRRVVLIGASGPVVLHCAEDGVTAITNRPCYLGTRRYKAISAPAGVVGRLNALRASRGLNWGTLLTMLADRLEGEDNA